MLEEFRVENFLSWIDLSFKPKDINLLIGLNNSGKSNLCNALRFLSYLGTRTFETTLKQMFLFPNNITNFSYSKPTVDFAIKAVIPFNGKDEEYTYNLSLSIPTLNSPTQKLKISQEKLSVNTDGLRDTALITSLMESVNLYNEPDSSYSHFSSPTDSTMLFQVYDNTNHPRIVNFKSYLGLWLYYDLSTEGLRSFKYNQNDFWLYPDGSNLSSVIYNLKKTNERIYRSLVESLKCIEPDIKFINFSGGDSAEPNIFMYFEYESGDSLPAWRASNGTLRFLALSYILLAQPNRFLIIEEPENGIYVGFLKKLMKLIPENKVTSQILFTSHSPYFIDLFDDKLENVFVSNRDKYRSTLSKIDVEKTQQKLEKYPLGELHFRELL